MSAEFKSTLAEILSTLKDHGNKIDKLFKENQSPAIMNVVGDIYQRTEDMSKKLDHYLNTDVTKVPKTTLKQASKTTPPKKKVPAKKDIKSNTETNKEKPAVIKNIMAYFKTRFIEDQTFFDDILEENQAKSLFAEHDTEIKSKKESFIIFK